MNETFEISGSDGILCATIKMVGDTLDVSGNCAVSINRSIRRYQQKHGVSDEEMFNAKHIHKAIGDLMSIRRGGLTIQKRGDQDEDEPVRN